MEKVNGPMEGGPRAHGTSHEKGNKVENCRFPSSLAGPSLFLRKNVL